MCSNSLLPSGLLICGMVGGMVDLRKNCYLKVLQCQGEMLRGAIFLQECVVQHLEHEQGTLISPFVVLHCPICTYK